MSSLNRSLTGPILTFDLQQQARELRADEAYQRTGRVGRTLTKSGRLRLVLVVLTEGNVIQTHQADSPLTIQVIEGVVHFRAAEVEHRLNQGEVLFFGPGDAHDIRAIRQSVLLLTLSAIGDDYAPDLGIEQN